MNIHNEIDIFAKKFDLHNKSEMLRQWKINTELHVLF